MDDYRDYCFLTTTINSKGDFEVSLKNGISFQLVDNKPLNDFYLIHVHLYVCADFFYDTT